MTKGRSAIGVMVLAFVAIQIHSLPLSALAQIVPRTLSGHSEVVDSVAYSPDGRNLASGSDDKTIKIWDMDSGSLLRTLSGHSDSVRSVVYSPDGRQLASASHDKTIKIWDMPSGSLIRTLYGHGAHIYKLAYSPDGRYLASGSGDKTIKIWDTSSGSLQRTIAGHGCSIVALAYSPDGGNLASGSCDKSIKLWDTASGSRLRTLRGGSYVISVAYSPDGRQLASGNSDKTIRIWDLTSGSLLRTLSDPGDLIDSVIYSPDGRSLVSGSDNTIKIWDTTSGSLLRTLSGHSSNVNSVAFRPDGRSIVSGSSDSTINVWDLTTDEGLAKHSPSTTAPQSAQPSPPTASNTTPNTETEQQRQERIRARAQELAQETARKEQSEEEEARRLAGQLVATQKSKQTEMNPTPTDTLPTVSKKNKDRPIGDKWAVIVGVDNFADPTVPKLHYSKKDARDFYQYLTTKAGFKPDHVRLLLDEKATRERIWTEIGDVFLPHVVSPDDLVVLYFSTHGSPAEKDIRGSSYLIAYDTKKSRLYADGIEMPMLLASLQKRTGADRVLIVLDACHSGAADPGAKSADFQSSLDIDQIAVGRGNIIITSSQPDERSWESKHYANGIFTRRLIDSLSQNPNVIQGFDNLKDIVANEVRQEHGQHQTPRLKADGWEGRQLLLTAPATKSFPITDDVKKQLEPDSKTDVGSPTPVKQ